MIRIGITGVPGSGKTVLARALASKCRGIKVELVQEYARSYILKYGNITNISEQYHIFEKQLDLEDSFCSNKLDLLITDSPIFLGFIYSCELPKANLKEVMFFNDIFEKMIRLNYPIPRYHAIFHLGLEIKPIDDGIRPPQHFDEKWRKKADMMIQSTMEIFKPNLFYIINQEDLDKRVDFCIEKIKKFINNADF